MDLRKGTMCLIFAWGVMLATGYALTLYLARHLSLGAYGDYGLVIYHLNNRSGG